MNALVPGGGNGGALIPTNMESAMRLAEMMARGKLVPQHLHNSPGDCLMVVEASMRWGMSPFAVAQCTSVIQGKLMFEGKLVAAALNASGILSKRLDYEFTGQGADRVVIARGTLRGEATPREMPMALKDAKTSNGMWVKQPDQQLVYAVTRAWARRHAPEVMLGVYSPEEFETPQREAFTGQTIEAERIPPGQPRDTARAIGDELPASAMSAAPATAEHRRTWADLLDDIRQQGAACATEEDAAALGESADVTRVYAHASASVQADLTTLLGEVMANVRRAADADSAAEP